MARRVKKRLSTEICDLGFLSRPNAGSQGSGKFSVCRGLRPSPRLYTTERFCLDTLNLCLVALAVCAEENFSLEFSLLQKSPVAKKKKKRRDGGSGENVSVKVQSRS